MYCVECDGPTTRVLKTERLCEERIETGSVKRRFRECRSCRKQFYTYEVHEQNFDKLQLCTPRKSRPKSLREVAERAERRSKQ